jgi:hypothetical protein
VAGVTEEGEEEKFKMVPYDHYKDFRVYFV